MAVKFRARFGRPDALIEEPDSFVEMTARKPELPENGQGGSEILDPGEGALDDFLGEFKMAAVDEIEELGGSQHQQGSVLYFWQALQHGGFDLAFYAIAFRKVYAFERTGKHKACKEVQTPLDRGVRIERILLAAFGKLFAACQPFRI
jgi:hypothetical protein